MKLIYNSGRERCEIIEEKDFNESIFVEQYIRSLSLIHQFISNNSSENKSGILKIVAFCGDRGSGKSSCMRTVINMLIDPSRKDIKEFIAENNYKLILNTSFEILDVIDPSFFDTCHNVLELVLGIMYGKAIGIKHNNSSFDFTCINHLMKDFQKAKSCVHTLHNTKDGVFDELQELDALSAGVELKTYIDSLIDNYLKIMNKQWLVIPIDDIDFNMENAYTMCEQIRKYLSSPKCIVLIGVKLEQLQNTISINFSHKINSKNGVAQQYFSDHDFLDMAKKYVAKFLPVSCCINMPQLYNLSERNINLIINPFGNSNVLSLKDAIVSLIFNRTRYMFYNSKGSISPIIPNNLRDFISLVGLLVSMPSVNNSYTQNEQLKKNKRLFKSYFFNTWIGYLPKSIAKKVESLIGYGVGNTLNKKVVSIIKASFVELLERDYINRDSDGIDKEKIFSRLLIGGILDEKNFSYNVSVGDVFYLFRLIEMEHLDDNDANLIFFLKSMYSIKLYEEYENITEMEDMVYPKDDYEYSDDSRAGIYRIDERFMYTNSLQRLLCGGYFTYCPGDLLPANKDGVFFDLNIVSGEKLNSLLTEIKEKIKNGGELDNIFYNKLRLAEFFILTTTRSVSSGNNNRIIEAINQKRSNYIPFYLTRYNKNTRYYLFDILAPFYNISNIKFAYERFSEIVPELYEFVVNDEKSLLGQMLKKCEESRKGIDYGFNPPMHRLLSDAIIRNAEVLSAVFENAETLRGKDHKATDVDSISKFYGKIMNSKMATLPINAFVPEYDESYNIQFSFLYPLQEFIKNMDENAKQLFTQILTNNNVPTSDEIIKSIGNPQKPKKIRDCIKKMNYFKNFTDERLKEIIPDTDTHYSKAEREELIKKWVDENNSINNK